MSPDTRLFSLLAVIAALCLALPATAGSPDGLLEPSILELSSLPDALESQDARAARTRCGTPEPMERAALYGIEGGDASDCNAFSTNPTADYDPNFVYRIPVVVHIIMNSAGTVGVISDAMVDSQIEILNEDFNALMGTNGANGNYGGFEFYLADEDPMGNPAVGITRSMNDTWFNDGGSYWNSLAWDPNRYLNIYTNNAGGNLGYVPFLPADAGGSLVGANNDRVVILWDTFGRNAPFVPFHLGRTGTHELGHYFGLEHTFSGGCGSATLPGCNTDGDLICDTNPESSPTFGCPGSRTSCSLPAPFDNYMDYSDDICMEMFTPEQVRRMRCSLEFYRPNLFEIVQPRPEIFTDGFESGNTTSWDTTVTPI